MEITLLFLNSSDDVSLELGASIWLRRPHRLDLHAQRNFDFIFIRSDPKWDVPRRRRQRRLCRIEVDRAPMMIALAQAQNEMLLLYRLRRRDRLDFAGKKKRRRISIAEWLEHFVPVEKIAIEFRKRELMIDAQICRGGQILIRQKFARRATESFRKKVDIFLLHR